MGGPNSGRRTRTEELVKSMKGQQFEPKTPIATEMFLPNLSGDHSRGRVRVTPTTDFEFANKKYVDDEIAGIVHPSSTFIRGATQVVAANDSKDTTNADLFCDGTADEVQIIAAIDALPATGGSVLLMDGTYEIAAAITMNKANVKLIGQGKSTILNIGTAIKTVDISAHFCEVNSIQFTGAKTSNFYGISATSVDWGKVVNCWFDTNYYGIRTQSCDHWLVTNNTMFGNFQEAIKLDGANNEIIGNLLDIGTTNIALQNVGVRSNVTGNTIIATLGSYGIRIGRGGSISGNTLHCTGGDGGIFVTAGEQTITGNVIFNASIGIFISSGNDNSIIGNYLESSSGQAILCDADNCTITGNTIFDNASSSAAIHIRGNLCTVANNSLNKIDREAIELQGADHCVVTGNSIQNCSEDTDDTYSGILLRSTSTNNIVSNNRISADAANKHKYGIKEDTSADDSNVITDNLITDAQTADILVQGVNSTLVRTPYDKRSVILTLDDFRKGTTAPTDATIGSTPTIPVLLFDATNELLSFHVVMPIDWDKTKDCTMDLVFSLVNTETDADTLSVTIDYTTIFKNTTGAGVAKTSTQLTPTIDVSTANGLAIGDIYTMSVTLAAADANNGFIRGDKSVGFCAEFHLTNIDEVTDIHFLGGCVNYIPLY